MRRYDWVGGPFTKVHDRFVHEDRSYDWDALRQADYGPRTRERGRRSFVLRALDEQRSLLAFSELLQELTEAGAPIDVIGALSRIVRDEARHVDLCGRVVDALGGWPEDAPEPRWVRSNPKLPLQRRILRSVVGSLCIGETVSVAMIAGVRENATEPVLQQLLTDLLADESYHSRFGWWWLEQFASELSDDDHAFLERWLPKVFASVERAARPNPEALRKQRPYDHGPFGSMSPHEREAAFSKVMEQRILPSFEKHGIAAVRAWQQRPRPSA